MDQQLSGSFTINATPELVLPRAGYAILLVLADYEPRTVTQLKQLGFTNKDLSYGLRRLREKELIDCRPNMSDLRMNYYSLKPYIDFSEKTLEILKSNSKKKPRKQNKLKAPTPDLTSKPPKLITRPTITHESDFLVNIINNEEVSMI
ncbi:hypothetical protein LCGC14_0303510 [marine sediment metagenome]|uniref:Uncharacterized protein n=1 Tax=marine sediment metagenome TaxID=412755 RepID=A0A0F9TPT9_9ZZZZ